MLLHKLNAGRLSRLIVVVLVPATIVAATLAAIVGGAYLHAIEGWDWIWIAPAAFAVMPIAVKLGSWVLQRSAHWGGDPIGTPDRGR